MPIIIIVRLFIRFERNRTRIVISDMHLFGCWMYKLISCFSGKLQSSFVKVQELYGRFLFYSSRALTRDRYYGFSVFKVKVLFLSTSIYQRG